MLLLLDVVELLGKVILHKLLFIIVGVFKQHVVHGGPEINLHC